ncbi:acyl-CoA dehydrogenase family protein [Nocardia spumae]|uniref:acyl-CoA dehydrogenase family protein n=1 Tax=Nocardia spumae TaxID=2887190 RepID=UPI001D152A1A|nr:acyl-CoA dehydrogenase family protein [Nocardia spumae]
MRTDEQLLADTADKTFRQCAEGPQAWRLIEELGLTRIGIAEELGGSGGDAEQARIVLRSAAYHAVALPLAETLWLAAPLLADARLPIPDGPLTVASAAIGQFRVRPNLSGSSWQLDGVLRRVPWARSASRIVVAADDRVCLVDPSDCRITHGANLAGEPRDEVYLDGVTVDADDLGSLPYRVDLRERGALARSVQIGGAAQRALDHSLEYATQRVQFGRPIAAFQAVQQYLAQMAGEVAAANLSVASAVHKTAGRPNGAHLVATARVNACRAAGIVAELAHQVHGAIGTTREHDLRLATTRLWSWREEFGGEAEWARVLGDKASADGDPWHLVTRYEAPYTA